MAKFFKHGDDMSHLDQIFNSLCSVAEHSLPSLLKTLADWYKIQHKSAAEFSISKRTSSSVSANAAAEIRESNLERRNVCSNLLSILVACGAD